MAMIELFKGWKPRPYQQEFFRAINGIGQPKKDRIFHRWCRRSGKDLTDTLHLFTQMIQVPANYVYFFPTYSQGRKAWWERVDIDTGKSTLDLMPKELIAGELNHQDMRMRLKNGSILRVVGSDKIDSVVGINTHGIIFSEWAYSDPYAWTKMQPILSQNKGWAIFNSTPNGRNHMYDMENRIKKSGRWHFSEVQTLWPEKPNYYPVVSLEDIQEARDSGIEEAMIEQEYGASYTAGIQGSFYSEAIKEIRDKGQIGLYPVINSAPVDTYWDLGYGDSTAIWFVQKQGGAYVFIDYHEASGEDIGKSAAALKEKGYNYGMHYLPHDGGNHNVGVSFSMDRILSYSLVDLRLSSVVRVATRLGVEEGIQASRHIMPQCYFDEGRCEDGIRKLEAYHRKWDSKAQVFMKTPAHDWSSHCADAFRTFSYFNVLHHGIDGPGDAFGGRDRVPKIIDDDWDPCDD